MKMDDILSSISIIDKNLKNRNTRFTEIEQIYARAIKLNEEVWELMSLLLANSWDQREDKLDKYNREQLDMEFADVIITTLLLAKSMNIDIKSALLKKINKIKDRWWI